MIAPFVIHHGDCLEVLRGMTDSSIDSIVTDPPYGLSFMGKRWDCDVPATEVWAECLRVLKPGGHLLAFAGTRTQHRMAVRIEDAGFEIRDMIAWVYGSGFPKSKNLDGDREGWGTALKPALEPITMARKPLIGTVAANVQVHGTGALNIDGCRVGTAGGTKAVDFGEATGNVYGAGAGKPSNAVASINAGRWPANLIHDGSDEVTARFPVTTSGAMKASTQRAAQDEPGSVCYGTFGGAVARADIQASSGSAARFFYCAKASKADRGVGNTHPTVKPTELMAYLCRLVTPPGGTVLDPFTGSGSTGKAAMREGFRFIGIEREAESVEIARARVAAAAPVPVAPESTHPQAPLPFPEVA